LIISDHLQGQSTIFDQIEDHWLRIIKGIKLNTVRAVSVSRDHELNPGKISTLAEALKVNSTVYSVNFERNPIGDEGLSALSLAFQSNSSVTSLNLEECEIQGEGIQSLAAAIRQNPSTSVSTLHLSRNPLGPDAYEHC
jgi:hypothetical protein